MYNLMTVTCSASDETVQVSPAFDIKVGLK